MCFICYFIVLISWVSKLLIGTVYLSQFGTCHECSKGVHGVLIITLCSHFIMGARWSHLLGSWWSCALLKFSQAGGRSSVPYALCMEARMTWRTIWLENTLWVSENTLWFRVNTLWVCDNAQWFSENTMWFSEKALWITETTLYVSTVLAYSFITVVQMQCLY